jgi:hypothetical protein
MSSARKSVIQVFQVEGGYMAKVDGQLTPPELVFACEMLKQELFQRMQHTGQVGRSDLGRVPVRRADEPRND